MFVSNFIKARISRIRLFIDSIRSKSPRDKCFMVEYWATFLASLVGCEVTDPNYKPYWKSLIPLLCLIDGGSLLIYTLIFQLIRKDYMKCLEVLCLIGVIVPVRN